MLTPVYPPYKAGMAHVAWQHASFLREAGHRVTVVTPRYNNISHDTTYDDVVRVQGMFTFGNAAYISSFKEIESKLAQADVILLEYPFIDCIGALAKVMNNHRSIKLAVYYHMDLIAHNWKRIPFAYYTSKAMTFFNRLQQQGRLHIAASSLDYLAGSDAAQFLDSATEIPLGVDEKHFTASPNDYAQTKLEISKDRKVALFVGALDRAHDFKGVRNIIAAMKENENITVVIVGDGDKKAYYEQEARGLKNVVFTGKVSRETLVALYQSADVVVLPSDSSSEAFGMVLAEAQMCGTSVIASDLRGVRGVVNPTTGILIPPRDVQALIQALQKIPKKKSEIMKNNREFAEKWNTNAVSQKFVAWVQGVAGEEEKNYPHM